MNWRKIILWSLPLWVIIALLFGGIRPLSKIIHDRHAEHARHEELAAPRRMAPLPPEEVRPEDITEPVTPPHIRHEAPDEPAAKHWIDEHVWVLDYIIEYGTELCGLLLAIGQVYILLKFKEKKKGGP